MVLIKSMPGWNLCGLILLFWYGAASAVPPSLNLIAAANPVEVFRGGQLQTPEPNLPMMAGDQVLTGPEGRASLKSDSMAMNLGADSELVMVGSDAARKGQPPVLLLQLVRGVLRVEEPAASKARQLRLNVADLRLSLSASEIWAMADDTHRTVCLVRGQVDVRSSLGNRKLEQAGDCLVADSSGLRVERPGQAAMQKRLAMASFSKPAPVPVSPPRNIKPESAVAAAPERAPPPSVLTPAPAPSPRRSPPVIVIEPSMAPAPAMPLPQSAPEPPAAPPAPLPPLISATDGPESGGWTLVSMALGDAESARREAQLLIERGLPGIVRLNNANGLDIYRVTLGSFATREQAKTYNNQIEERLGIPQLWIAPY